MSGKGECVCSLLIYVCGLGEDVSFPLLNLRFEQRKGFIMNNRSSER